MDEGNSLPPNTAGYRRGKWLGFLEGKALRIERRAGMRRELILLAHHGQSWWAQPIDSHRNMFLCGTMGCAVEFQMGIEATKQTTIFAWYREAE